METVNRLIEEIKTDSNVYSPGDRYGDEAGVGLAQFFTRANQS